MISAFTFWMICPQLGHPASLHGSGSSYNLYLLADITLLLAIVWVMWILLTLTYSILMCLCQTALNLEPVHLCAGFIHGKDNRCFGEIKCSYSNAYRDDLCKCSIFNFGPYLWCWTCKFEEFCYSVYNTVIQWKSTFLRYILPPSSRPKNKLNTFRWNGYSS